MDQASATARLGDALLVVDLQSCFRRLHLRLVRARPDLDGPRRCGPARRPAWSPPPRGSGRRPERRRPHSSVRCHPHAYAMPWQRRRLRTRSRTIATTTPRCSRRIGYRRGRVRQPMSSCSGVWVLTSGPYTCYRVNARADDSASRRPAGASRLARTARRKRW